MFGVRPCLDSYPTLDIDTLYYISTFSTPDGSYLRTGCVLYISNHNSSAFLGCVKYVFFKDLDSLSSSHSPLSIPSAVLLLRWR